MSAATVRRLSAEGTALPAAVTPTGTRREILDAALRLFAERGFAGASIRDVAREAGVQPATIYAHYPSKEHLLADLIEIGHREHQRRFREALLESGPDPREQLAAFVRAHVVFHAELSMLAVVTNDELHMLSASLAAPSWELRKQSIEQMTAIVSRGFEHGVFQGVDAWIATAAIGSMGLRVAYWYTPDYALSPAQVADEYVKIALRIVGAAPDPGGLRR